MQINIIFMNINSAIRAFSKMEPFGDEEHADCCKRDTIIIPLATP
jgi:hypothetical protein